MAETIVVHKMDVTGGREKTLAINSTPLGIHNHIMRLIPCSCS